MPPKSNSSAIARFEAELRQAARAFAARDLARPETGEAAALAFARRFGLVSLKENHLNEIGTDVRAKLAARLEEENARLLRAARRQAPGYDLNRHMAVRRALNALVAGCAAPALAQPTPDKPLSGRELNSRFRAHARRRPAHPGETASGASRVSSTSRSPAMALSLAACIAR